MSTVSQSAYVPHHRIGWTLGMGLLAAALSLLAPHRLPAEAAGLVSLITADEVETVSFVDKRTSLEPAVQSDRQATPLFGMDTEPVISGDVLDKWTHTRAEIDQELAAVAQCRTTGICSSAALRLIDLSAAGAGRNGRARIGMINRAVDLAIRPADDERQWGVPDRWSSAFETLQSSRGDCEDYAIVKYLALRAAGIADDEIKIVILKNVFPDEDHATVAVRVDDEWLILDNRTLTLVRDTDLTRAIPRFALDQQGARRFVWASRRPRGGAVSGS